MDPDDTDEPPAGGDDGGSTDDVERITVDVEDETAENPSTEGTGSSTADEVDQRIVDLLSWILDTETRAKIYVFLLANPGSTSEEVAKGTGLYPSTVREALADLHDEERVSREKRASEGAGNNPYEYTAIQPSELVGSVVDQVQRELNTIVNLDQILDRETTEDEELGEDAEPVTITVGESEDGGTDESVNLEDTGSSVDESGDAEPGLDDPAEPESGLGDQDGTGADSADIDDEFGSAADDE